MFRIAIFALTLIAGYDHVAYNGKFTSAAMQASTSILHHFRVM